VTFTVIAVVCLSLFVWWELRTDHPAVDLRLLKNVSFTSGTLIGGILGVSLFSGMFLLPLFMQTLMGFTAMQSGLALMPRTLAMMALMPVAGFLFNKMGARRMVSVGLAISAYAVWMMSRFTAETTMLGLVIPQVIQGVGFSLIFVSLSTAALSTVPRERMTNATGLYNLVRQLGGSFGIAVFATMLEKRMSALHTHLIEYANPYNPAFQGRLQALQHYFMSLGADARTAQQQALGMIDNIVRQQAGVMAYEYLFALSALLLLFCLPLVFTLNNKVGRGHAGEEPIVEL
jgi:DHA2 family multidrug resistance protein